MPLYIYIYTKFLDALRFERGSLLVSFSRVKHLYEVPNKSFISKLKIKSEFNSTYIESQIHALLYSVICACLSLIFTNNLKKKKFYSIPILHEVSLSFTVEFDLLSFNHAWCTHCVHPCLHSFKWQFVI